MALRDGATACVSPGRGDSALSLRDGGAAHIIPEGGGGAPVRRGRTKPLPPAWRDGARLPTTEGRRMASWDGWMAPLSPGFVGL